MEDGGGVCGGEVKGEQEIVMKDKDGQDNKWPGTDSLTGDKFWCAVSGDGSLPVVSAKYTDVDMIRRVSELVDSMDTPLQINPDGTTKWIIGTEKKGKRKNAVSLKQLQEAVGGYIELTTCKVTKSHRFMYVNEEGLLDNLAPNPFATVACDHGWMPIVGSVVLMPNKRST